MKKFSGVSRRGFVRGSLAALGTLGSVALVGCGGSSDTSSSSDSSSASTDAAGADSYILVEEGKLIGASDMAYPPLESISDTTGEPEGFEIDMMDAIAAKLGLEMEWLDPQKFDTIIPLIKQGGKCDVGVSAFTITDERKQEIDFSDSYLDSNQGLVTRSDATDKTEEALNVEGKKVAVQSGTTGEAWVEERLPNATCVPLDDAIQAMTGLQSGLYDAVVADLPVMSYLCLKSYTDCEVAIEIPTGEQYGIVISKENTKLTSDINQAISELKDDGTMASLEEKWFGEEL